VDVVRRLSVRLKEKVWNDEQTNLIGKSEVMIMEDPTHAGIVCYGHHPNGLFTSRDDEDWPIIGMYAGPLTNGEISDWFKPSGVMDSAPVKYVHGSTVKKNRRYSKRAAWKFCEVFARRKLNYLNSFLDWETASRSHGGSSVPGKHVFAHVGTHAKNHLEAGLKNGQRMVFSFGLHVNNEGEAKRIAKKLLVNNRDVQAVQKRIEEAVTNLDIRKHLEYRPMICRKAEGLAVRVSCHYAGFFEVTDYKALELLDSDLKRIVAANGCNVLEKIRTETIERLGQKPEKTNEKAKKSKAPEEPLVTRENHIQAQYLELEDIEYIESTNLGDMEALEEPNYHPPTVSERRRSPSGVDEVCDDDNEVWTSIDKFKDEDDSEEEVFHEGLSSRHAYIDV
jgi:hypothetical protein